MTFIDKSGFYLEISKGLINMKLKFELFNKKKLEPLKLKVSIPLSLGVTWGGHTNIHQWHGHHDLYN